MPVALPRWSGRTLNRRALISARKLLQAKAIAIENVIRGLLRNFGLKVGAVGAFKFEDGTRELVERMPELEENRCPSAGGMAKAEQFTRLSGKLHSIVRDDAGCRRLMTVPGVGALRALAFKDTIDIRRGSKTSRP